VLHRALGALTAALVGGVLVACTTTAGTARPATSGSGPVTVTEAGTGGAAGTSTGPGAPSAVDTGPAATGPFTRGSGMDAPTGAADTSPQIPSVSYRNNPDEVALEQVLPGMYGLDSLGASVSGTRVDIDTTASCDFVTEVIGAGQWTVAGLVTPTTASKTRIGILTDGGIRAVLSLTQTGPSCQGMIVAPVSATLRITGALSSDGPALWYPLTCPTGGGSDPIPMYGIYATRTATYLAVIGVVPSTGTHAGKGGDAAGDAEALFYQASGTADLGPALTAVSQLADLTSAASAGAGTGSTAASGSAGGLPPGWNGRAMFGTGDGSTVTTAVTSTDPLRGTATATALANPLAPSSTITVSATFSCG
jgi:hypothetical protein